MELIVAVCNDGEMLRVLCSHRQKAPILPLERRNTLLAVNTFTRVQNVEISDYRAFFVDVSAHEIVDVLSLRLLTGRSRIHQMHSLVRKPSVPVCRSQNRNLRRLYAFRKAIHIKIRIASASEIGHLKGELIVFVRMHYAHDTRLIDSHIIVEITELSDFQRIQISFITGKSDKLLTCHELKEVALMPLDVCIFDR